MMANASAGPTPWDPEQHLEAPPFVVVHEAVQDDRVLPHVRVHVQHRFGSPAGGHCSDAAVEGVTLTRYPTPATSTITSHSAVRRTTGPRSSPITSGSSRR